MDRNGVPRGVAQRVHARSRRRSLLMLMVAVAAAMLMRLPGLWLPLERDEGAYGYVAAIWLHGGLPYRDVFDHKPPLIYLFYMPALLGTTPSAFGIRVWSSLIFVLGLPLVFALGHRVWNRATAGLATLLYAVAGSAFAVQGLILNTEQALVLPALLGLWALLRAVESDRRRWSFVYGLCLGLVTLIKPTAVPLLLPLVLLGRAHGRWGYVRAIVAMALGFAAPCVVVLALRASAGALDELLFAVVDYNRLYTAESMKGWTAAGIVDTIAPLGPLLICAAGGAALAGWRDVRRRQRLAITLWTLAFGVAALLGLRAYAHYYYPMLPGLALLAAPSVMLLTRRPGAARWRHWAAAAASAVLLALLLLPFVIGNLRLAGDSPTEQAKVLYGPDGELYFGPAATVAAYIRSRTRPDQPIYVGASEPQIYLLSGRAAVSRYIYIYPLDLLPEARAELARDLRRTQPALVVLYHGFRPEGFAALGAAHGLRLERTIGGYDIWSRAPLGSE